MQTYLVRTSPWQKRIPTLLGVGVLVVGLVIGIIAVGTGTGVFAPRATPQTTPKGVKITNVTDTSFSVSFITDEETTGFVKYGQTATTMTLQASDDRDQLSGQVGRYSMHHITVRNISASTKYFFTIGTGSSASYDNNGVPFEITTGPRATATSAAKTIYGTVTSDAGSPADGAIVYAAVAGAGELSTLVKSSGSWAIPLAQARTPDLASIAQISDEDPVMVTVIGPQSTQTAQVSTTVAQAQPVAALIAGSGTNQASTTTAAAPIETSPLPLPSPSPIALSSASGSIASGSATASGSGGLAGEDTIIDTTQKTGQVVDTSQPVITGQLAPNLSVRVEINSNERIITNVTTDSSGEFEVDLAALGKNLEPGVHTVRLTYTDPTTGQLKEEVITFTVQGSSLLALAPVTPSPIPFGSSNPFPASSSATTSSAVATTSTKGAVATRSATSSGSLPKAGSVGLTVGLIGAGIFFLILGSASYTLSQWLLNRHLMQEFPEEY